MNLTHQEIYNTARNLHGGIKAFKDREIFFLFNQQDPIESIVDLMGSYKNLIIALNARSIEYNRTDLEFTLSMVRNNLDIIKSELDKSLDRISSHPFHKIINKGYWLLSILSYGFFGSSKLAIDTFHLDKIFYLIPISIAVVAITPVIISYLKILKLQKKYNVELNIEYLIQTLANNVNQNQ